MRFAITRQRGDRRRCLLHCAQNVTSSCHIDAVHVHGRHEPSSIYALMIGRRGGAYAVAQIMAQVAAVRTAHKSERLFRAKLVLRSEKPPSERNSCESLTQACTPRAVVIDMPSATQHQNAQAIHICKRLRQAVYFSFSAASSAARFLRMPSRLAFMRSTRSFSYTRWPCASHILVISQQQQNV